MENLKNQISIYKRREIYMRHFVKSAEIFSAATPEFL